MEISSYEKGDSFEKLAFKIIEKAIHNDELGIPGKYAIATFKPKYYSSKRGAYINFDISIEVWPKGAKNFSNLYLIECKNYKRSVSVDKLEQFARQVDDVAELNGKAVFISASNFTKTAIQIAQNTGMMLIKVDNTGAHSIILHNEDRNSPQIKNSFNEDFVIQNFLEEVFKTKKEKPKSSPKKYSKSGIQNIANRLAKKTGISPFDFYNQENLNKLVTYFENNHGIVFDFSNEIEISHGKKILGRFFPKKKLIQIDSSICETEKLSFVLLHEIGHYVFHRNLEIDQSTYNSYENSSYNVFIDKHTLKNPKNWIEWQANYFAVSVLLPQESLKNELIIFQKLQNISKLGHIYVDDQQVNYNDYMATLSHLSYKFNVSKTCIANRLKEMALITDNRKKGDLSKVLRESLNHFG